MEEKLVDQQQLQKVKGSLDDEETAQTLEGAML